MEENKTINEVVEEPIKEDKKSTSAKASATKKSTSSSTKTGTKKGISAKTSTTKKTSSTKTTTKKTTTPKKEIANPLDEMPVVKKKASGANSIEKALEKKIVEKNEASDVSKEDMKSRMQRIINASKKLNDSILEDDTKKAQMKEKLANAAQEMEKEYGAVEEDKNSVADSYLERNEKLKGKYADLSAKLAAMMAESNEYSEEAFEEEEEVLEEQQETTLENIETIENTETVEQEVVLETESPAEEAKEEIVEVEPTVEEEKQEIVEEIAEPVEQENLESAIVLDLVKEIKQQEETELVQEEQNEIVEEEKLAEPIKEVQKQEIIDTSIPELKEKPVEKKSVFKKTLDYVVKTMNGMAYGLFATLIIGTILETVAGFLTDGSTAETLLLALATLLKQLTGFGIGVGIAWGLKYDGIKLIALACVGAVAAYFSGAQYGFKVGDPLTVYLVVIITEILLSQIFRKKTPVDIIIVPLFTCLVSVAVTVLIGKYVAMVTSGLASFIGTATAYQPIVMGIVIAVIMGMALTAPISSAAIAAIVFVAPTTGDNIDLVTQGLAIAGGAALIGCCTQMVGFAIMSRKDNNFGTCIAIGIGTSMLQFKNILKKPIIWLPTIIVSAILGPISTTLIKLECMGTAAGMGTSGLVGMIGTFNQMGTDPKIWMYVIGFEIIVPFVLVLIVDIIFRKFKLIKQGDLKL